MNALNGVAGGVITKRDEEDGQQKDGSEFEKRDVGVALGLAVSLLKLLGISVSLGGLINWISQSMDTKKLMLALNYYFFYISF